MSLENQEYKEPSEQELAERRQQLMQFYKKELPLLRLRKEYEESIAAIEIAKMQVLEIMIAKAQMSQKNPENSEQTTGEPEEHFIPTNTEEINGSES